MPEITTLGSAVPGTVVSSGSLITPAGDQGPVGVQGPPGVTTLATTSANGLLKQVSGLTTDFIDGTNNSQALQPVIWSVRLGLNAIGNANFEITQRNCGSTVTPAASATTFIEDRWSVVRGATTGVVTAQHQGPGASAAAGIVVPGTNYLIANGYMRFTLTTQQTTLAATDYLVFQQVVEGPRLRELWGDVHSLQILARSSVANLKFGMLLADGTSKTLPKLCTLPSVANTWTLITLPNLPVWPSGAFSIVPGSQGYAMWITLATGATYMASANDAWLTGSNILGAVGQSNFLGQTVGSTLDFAFVQHEPGAQCSTLIDCPFTQNYGDCLRYFAKSYDYGVKPASNVGSNGPLFIVPAGVPTYAVGNCPFPKPMAKAPGTTSYANSGSSSACSIFGGADIAVASVSTTTTRINALNFSTSQTVGSAMCFHYTADTGW